MHCRHESGQATAEFSIILALVALTVIVALLQLGPKVASLFQLAAGAF